MYQDANIVNHHGGKSFQSFDAQCSSHKPPLATELLKWAWSEQRCAVSIKYHGIVNT